jgi:hypothetical protein
MNKCSFYLWNWNCTQHFAQIQEAAHKDVQHAFEVLQARFAIVARPSASWSRQRLRTAVKACIILHNMIVEDERSLPVQPTSAYDHNRQANWEPIRPAADRSSELSAFLRKFRSCPGDAGSFVALRNDLIAHSWTCKEHSEQDKGSMGGEEVEEGNMEKEDGGILEE